MVERLVNEYEPETVTAPGETLLETIEALGMTQAQLADRAGRPRKTINGIVKGKTAITPDTAIQFERVLGVPRSFWNNRQRRFDEFQARQRERAALEAQAEWAKRFPLTDLRKRGLVAKTRDKSELLASLLSFLGVASPESWERGNSALEVSYRKSEKLSADPYALGAWLRIGEINAATVHTEPFNAKRFRETLVQIRSLTTEPATGFQPRLEGLCASCGVVVVFVPSLPKTRASGATRWLTPSKALIQMSLRYKTDDQLWFTFFHEAAHILQDKKRTVFLEGVNDKGRQEEAANKFAAEFLVPQDALTQLSKEAYLSKDRIRAFASGLGIAPGIVVGQLQKRKWLPFTHCNDLKRRFTWSN